MSSPRCCRRSTSVERVAHFGDLQRAAASYLRDFRAVFHSLLLVPSAHAVIAVHMKREQRRHREVVGAIRRHGPPAAYPR